MTSSETQALETISRRQFRREQLEELQQAACTRSSVPTNCGKRVSKNFVNLNPSFKPSRLPLLTLREAPLAP
jgi:hypothetical protein